MLHLRVARAAAALQLRDRAIASFNVRRDRAMG
jgi:hypothetical protein